MQKLLILIFLILNYFNLIAQKNAVPVFISGADGYKSFRIPAIIKSPSGDLLAFAEGRVNNSGDFGDIDIVLKRSKDHGKTWSNLSVVADNGHMQAGNPAPVEDVSDPDYPEGRIFLFYNTGNNHEGEIAKGKGVKQCFFKTSVDGGLTWSSAIDITLQVHKPNQPLINSSYNFSEDWRCYANTPGHAMQFQSGKYKGRIFVAANHSAGPPQKAAKHYVAHGYFSDDHGKTFQLGNSLSILGSNESMAVELSENKLMMNSRNQSGDVKVRIVSISNNGGATWDSSFFDNHLIDPVCEGSILKMGVKHGKAILAFCNNADVSRRNNLLLQISYDEGKTWEKKLLIYKNQSEIIENFDYSAYCDLIQLDQKRIGILYEKDNYASITFSVKKWR